MDIPIAHINIINAIFAVYLIGYQISICSDWSWIPMNKVTITQLMEIA